LALNALYMPKAKMPAMGDVVAITDRNADSLTALATLSNRVAKRKVSDVIVKAIASRGEGQMEPDVNRAYKAITWVSEQQDMKIGEQLRYIRGILDGSAVPKDVAATAAKYDEARGIKLADPSDSVGNPTGVRGLGGGLHYYYQQVHQQADQNFDFALGVSNTQHIGNAKIIDRSGPQSIIQKVLGMSEAELPPPGSKIAIAETDTNRITAAAILESRIEGGTQMRDSLLNLILRDGADVQRIHPTERDDVEAAYKAIEGISSNPFLPARRKIAAVKFLLNNDVPAAKLEPVVAEHDIYRKSAQPFRYVRTTAFKPKPFDYGVEITDEKLAGDKPNLDHHQVGSTVDTPSATEQALLLPENQLPNRNSRVALQKPDADSLTAIAVMANRLDGLPVNNRLAEAIGRHDRGFDFDPQGQQYTDVERQMIGIRSIARNQNILIDQRIAGIRALLADKVDLSQLDGMQQRYNQNQWVRELDTEKTSTVQTV
ncbi:MAG: hypothetical protein ACRD3W_31690, partial [Terriglobales bacterium]